MVRRRSTKLILFFLIFLSLLAFGIFVPIFALLPPLSSHFPQQQQHHPSTKKYWEDRLLRAKALGLNTIQTYVPWNRHEPRAGTLDFDGIVDLVALLKLSQKLGILVMLRPGPYVCAEWDLGGFPPWLFAINPAPRLRSSDPVFLKLMANGGSNFEFYNGANTGSDEYNYYAEMFGFMLCATEYAAKDNDGGSTVSIPKGNTKCIASHLFRFQATRLYIRELDEIRVSP